MNTRSGPVWRLERQKNGVIWLLQRGHGIREPVAIFSEGEEVTAERVVAMLNTFSHFDHPGTPTYGPIREVPEKRARHEGGFWVE